MRMRRPTATRRAADFLSRQGEGQGEGDRRIRCHSAAPPAAAFALLLAAAGCGMLGDPAPVAPPPGAIVTRISTGAPPIYLAMTPDGAQVFAASSDNALRVIRTADNTVAATVKINPNPTGLTVAPDGARAYLTTLFSVDLTVIDAAANALLPPVTMFLQRFRGGFGRPAVAPDGRTVYVANRDNQVFGIIDLTGGHNDVLTPTVFPVDVAAAADGRTVYYVGCKPICTPGFLQFFDTASKRFTESVEVDGNPYRIALSPDGARAYSANLTGPSLSVVELASRQVAATIPVPPQPTGLAVSPDGASIYVASQTAGALTVVDAAALAVRGSVAIPQAREVVVTPDGRRLYVSSGSDVVVLDPTALPAS